MTDAELAILSLLAENPTYDHQLNQLIDQRGLRRWTAIGSSSMYYVLDKLEKQGLVQRITEHSGRRQYSITTAGTAVLQTSITDLLSTPHPYDKYFELGLANLHILKPQQVHTALLSRQHAIAFQIERLDKLLHETDIQRDPFSVQAMFSHRLELLKMEAAWLDDFIAQWTAQMPPETLEVIEPAIIPRSRQVVLPHDPDSVHKLPTREIPPYNKKTPSSNPTGHYKAPHRPPAEPDTDTSSNPDQNEL